MKITIDQTKADALAAEIGQRPARATSENRGLFRRWIGAHGAPYSAVGNLPLSDLSRLYNEADALFQFIAEIDDSEAGESTPPPLEIAPSFGPYTPPQTAAAAPTAKPNKPAIEADKASQLAALLGSLINPQTAPIDAAAVIALIKQHAAPVDEKTIRAIASDEAKKTAGILPTVCQIRDQHGAKIDAGVCHKNFPLLVQIIKSGCNIWLAGPAGTGKTTAAEKAAEALGLPFHFNGAIDSEHKLLGFTDAQGRIVSRPFREAFINGGVYLFDEVDASLPGALLAFNAALANGHCDFPDGCKRKHENFVAIAAANTWGQGATHDYVGRAKMDAAFIDRFVMLSWDTDEALERHIALAGIADSVKGNSWVDYVQRIRAKAAANGLKVVISPRASIFGCKLLQAGLTEKQVCESAIRKGMSADSWKSLNS